MQTEWIKQEKFILPQIWKLDTNQYQDVTVLVLLKILFMTGRWHLLFSHIALQAERERQRNREGKHEWALVSLLVRTQVLLDCMLYKTLGPKDSEGKKIHCLQQAHILAWEFSSVQFSLSVVSNPLRPHELQHAWPPCLSPTSRVHTDSCPLSQ